MSRRAIFWVLMLIWFVFGILTFTGIGGQYALHGGQVLTFVLFFLLGWQAYGPPVQG